MNYDTSKFNVGMNHDVGIDCKYTINPCAKCTMYKFCEYIHLLYTVFDVQCIKDDHSMRPFTDVYCNMM